MDRTRTRICLQCVQPFTYQAGRGRDRRICSPKCDKKRRRALEKAQPKCIVPDCKNPKAYRSGLCNTCYYRLQRTGTLARRTPRHRTIGTNGYVRISHSAHPLATSEGWVYEHRLVLYDAIGEGPHNCHWCKTPVLWIKGLCRKGSLVPDHLDGDKTNNTLSNLVPACNPCNSNRGLFVHWVKKHKDDPFLWALYQQALATA